MQKIRWLFLIMLIGVGLVITVQNPAETEISVLTWSRLLPLSVLLLIATGIGFLLGAIMTASMLRSRKVAAKRKEKEKERAKAEAEAAKKAEPAVPAESTSEKSPLS